MASPRGFLKAYTPDEFSDSPIELFHHRRTPMDPEGAPDELILEEVLEHEEKDRKMFFKVKLECWEDPTLEPASNFYRDFPAA